MLLIKDYKQGDKRWAFDECVPGKNINLVNNGCFLTTIANILYDKKKKIGEESVNPKNLNILAKKLNCYNDEGFLQADKLLAHFNLHLQKVKLKPGLSDRISDIQSSLKQGYVIGEFKNHFVNITGVDSDGNLTVKDPGYAIPKTYHAKDLLSIRIVKEGKSENGTDTKDTMGRGSGETELSKNELERKIREQLLLESNYLKLGNSFGFTLGNLIANWHLYENKIDILKDAVKNFFISQFIGSFPLLSSCVTIMEIVKIILDKKLDIIDKIIKISGLIAEFIFKALSSHIGLVLGAKIGAYLGIYGGPIGFVIGVVVGAGIGFCVGKAVQACSEYVVPWVKKTINGIWSFFSNLF